MNTLNVTRIALRIGVCTDCTSRSPLVEGAPPTDPRACEGGCELFYYLPRLSSLIRRYGGEPPCGYELVVLNLPCRQCGEPARHAEQCESCQGQRPLERYIERTLATIERIEAMALGAGRKVTGERGR